MSRRRIGLFALVLIALGCASPAAARLPGHWSQITDSDGSQLGEVTLARTSDGILHAAWVRPSPAHPASAQDLLDRSISASGTVSAPSIIQAGWSSIENPALVSTGGRGLDLFAGAIRSLDMGETISNLAFLSSADGGAHWSLQGSDVTNTDAAFSSDVSAALGSGGTPFETWGSSDCLCVHRGTSSAASNADFQAGLGDFGYEPGMAVDPSTHGMAVAWYSNATHHSGVYAAMVNQTTGQRIGTPMQMPGTGNLHDGPFGGRAPIVGRAGGGLFVAYEAGSPSHTKVLVWRVGQGQPKLVARNGRGVGSVGLASSPDGRLWVFWSTLSASDKPLIHVRRSNRHVTSWGGTVTIRPPRNASSSWNLVGNGQDSRLDLVGSFSLGSSSHAASWYTQILPGLTLTASPTRLRKGTARPVKVRFTASDAGTPVSGARVSVGHVTGLTNGQGQVKLALGPFQHRGRITARARASGYAFAQVQLRVR